MPSTRMLLFTMILMGALPNRVDASEAAHGHAPAHETVAPNEAVAHAVAAAVKEAAPAAGHAKSAAPAHHESTEHLATEVAEAPAAEHAPAASAAKGPVVALDASSGRSFREGEMIEAGPKVLSLVDKKNNKIDLAPASVAEFGEAGMFRLLRGSAVAETKGESSLRTSSARVDFAGRVAISYDHKESSTSAFVLDGEARVVNAHGEDQSLRLERYRGATMVVGEVMPQLIRQLDVGGVRSWLAGYAWPNDKMNELLQALPEAMASAPSRPAGPRHKLEDYFSAIDTADENGQPDYYDRKFQDPDAAVAAANQPKSAVAKPLTPEEAALIALPSTKIDLGFSLPPEVLSADEKARELRKAVRSAGKEDSRLPASVKNKKGHAPASVQKAESGDPEINAVLARLRSVQAKEPVISSVPEFPKARGPSSVNGGAVPDPVYDYSQNF